MSQQQPIPDQQPSDVYLKIGGEPAPAGPGGALPTPTPSPTTGPAETFTPVTASDETFTPVDDDQSFAHSLGKLATEFIKQQPIHPIAVGEALTHPVQAVQSMLAAQTKVYNEAVASFESGDHARAMAKFAEWLVPLLGPALSEEGNNAEKGEYAKALGGALGIGANFLVKMKNPEAVAKKLGATMQTPTAPAPASMAAGPAEFAAQHDIPLTFGESTGSQALQNTERVAEDASLAGAVLGPRLRGQQTAAMTRVGRQLASDVSPTPSSPETAGAAAQDATRGADAQVSGAYGKVADQIADRVNPQPVTPEAAMTSVADSLTQKAAATRGEGRVHYNKLEDIEADPANAREVVTGHRPSAVVDAAGRPVQVPVSEIVPLPVDLADIKSDLQGVYDDLNADPQWTEPRRQNSPGYRAIEQLVQGPDVVPLSHADRMLSALKTVTRSATGNARRLALLAQSKLERAVGRTVRSAGPEAESALAEGRAAWKSAIETDEVMAALKEEPVKAFGQLVAKNDTAIGLLRTIAKETPHLIPEIARAYLDDLFKDALSGNQFDFAKARTLGNHWNALGDATKKILFKDPQVVRQLDDFFLNARRVAQRPITPAFGVEPVQAFNALVQNRDLGIWRLRTLAKLAPDVPQLIGRAWIEDWLNRATAEHGKFQHTAALRAAWDKLGPQTKKILFGDHAADINSFVRVGDEIQWKDPNSKTAVRMLGANGKLALFVYNHMAAVYEELGHSALAAALLNPRIARALIAGMKTPVTKVAASAATTARILNFTRPLGAVAQPLAALPKAASGPTQAPPPQAAAPDPINTGGIGR